MNVFRIYFRVASFRLVFKCCFDDEVFNQQVTVFQTITQRHEMTIDNCTNDIKNSENEKNF